MSTLRKLAEITDRCYPGFSAIIYRDAEWHEFRARLVRHGVPDKESDAFEDTREDAFATGFAMIGRAHALATQADIRSDLDADEWFVRPLVDAEQAAARAQLPMTVTRQGNEWTVVNAVTTGAFWHRDMIVTVLPPNYFGPGCPDIEFEEFDAHLSSLERGL